MGVARLLLVNIADFSHPYWRCRLDSVGRAVVLFKLKIIDLAVWSR